MSENLQQDHGETPAVPQPPLSAAVRRLTPANTRIFEGTFSLLHCAVQDDTLYRGVFAVLMFPASHPSRFISLRYNDAEGKTHEIGLIADLSVFPANVQELVQASLEKHYYEHLISRVYSVECEYGILFFDVETQRGREQFVMPWRQDRAEDYGPTGKVLLDALDNRYIIKDVSALPRQDHRRFTNYIYW
jgi:hypothetical protein